MDNGLAIYILHLSRAGQGKPSKGTTLTVGLFGWSDGIISSLFEEDAEGAV